MLTLYECCWILVGKYPDVKRLLKYLKYPVHWRGCYCWYMLSIMHTFYERHILEYVSNVFYIIRKI